MVNKGLFFLTGFYITFARDYILFACVKECVRAWVSRIACACGIMFELTVIEILCASLTMCECVYSMCINCG